jgi:ATP/maltotriose-dependent transcriptional regulator MalT
MPTLLETADELITLSKDEDFFLWYSVGYTYRAIISEALAEREEALALMDEGLELFEQTDSRLTLVLMNVLCAEAFHRLGQSERALDKLQVAETEMRERDEGLFAPEIWRIRGTILANRRDDDGAEEAFREAIHRAHHQSAVALELRAGLDLYDLKARQGRAEQGRDALSEPLSRYSEGFDHPEPTRAAAIVQIASG